MRRITLVLMHILIQPPSSYRVITLLNCLGKVVEKVAANAIAAECERRKLLHDGQFGCRKRRSAIDAVGRLMKRVEEAWGRGNTVTGVYSLSKTP